MITKKLVVYFFSLFLINYLKINNKRIFTEYFLTNTNYLILLLSILINQDILFLLTILFDNSK